MKMLRKLTPDGDIADIIEMPDGCRGISWNKVSRTLFFTDWDRNYICTLKDGEIEDFRRWPKMNNPRGIFVLPHGNTAVIEEDNDMSFKTLMISYRGELSLSSPIRMKFFGNTVFRKSKSPLEFRKVNGVAWNKAMSGALISSERGNCIIGAKRNRGVFNVLGNGKTGFSVSNDPLECMFDSPRGICCNDTGNLVFVADTGNSVIRCFKWASNSFTPHMLAGSPLISGHEDGSWLTTKFTTPGDMAYSDGTVYVVDDNMICSLSVESQTSEMVYTSPYSLSAICSLPGGVIYFIEESNG